MSTSGIGSVPGFDVLFPNGEPSLTASAANATYASTVPGFNVLDPTGTDSSSTGSSSTSSSTSSNATSTSTNATSTSTPGLNQYQQAVVTLDDWQAQILGASIEGDLSGATSALYSSAGLSADAFANLASELQNIQSAGTSGSTVDTSA